MSRPNWGQFFMMLAQTASMRSSCPRLAVGAVLVQPDTRAVLALGYNGAVRGQPSCLDVACHLEKHVAQDGTQKDHCSRGVHAEQNALYHAASQGISVNGAVCYVTAEPCWLCARALYQSGVKRVMYSRPYGGTRHPLLEALLKGGDMVISQLEPFDESPKHTTKPGNSGLG